MAELRLTFRTYAIASTFCVLALVVRTWYIHEELYTIVAVLTTQKVALAVLYNFVFMLLVGTGKLVLHVLLGQLRDLEVEQVLDSGRGFLLDTVLFLVLSSPTLDGADVSTYALAKFLLFLVALKTAHLVVQIRGATMFEVGHPRVPALLRVCLVLSALLSMDLFAVHFFLLHASRQSTFYLWLLFECLGMLASCAICVVKFGVHLVDVRLDNGWTSKSAVIFYLELVHDVTNLGIFLLFMTVFFITQPSRLPLYMTADIIHVVKALYKRILSLKKYRSLTRNLETRFPDATPEELEAADTCIICRDFLYDGSKKLPCSHIFHIDCLRSWLVQQQSCPTCRAEIPTDDASASAAATATSPVNNAGRLPAGRSRGVQPQQQQEGSRGASVTSLPGCDGASSALENSSAGSVAGPSVGSRRDRSATYSGIRAKDASSTLDEDAAPASNETAAGGDKLRPPDADGVPDVHDSARDLKKAEDVSDTLGLSDVRMKRRSERPETPAATPPAAAASAAAATNPTVQPCPSDSAHKQRSYAQQIEAALRQRVMQMEAVVTDAMVQALALSYHMCDVYRLHASLWTVEAQHAQLEACRKLLQQTAEVRNCTSPYPVPQAEVFVAEDKPSSKSFSGCVVSIHGAALSMPPAPGAADADSSTDDAKKPQQQQHQDHTHKRDCVFACQTLSRTASMEDASAREANFKETTCALRQPAAAASETSLETKALQLGTAGAPHGYDCATVKDAKTCGDPWRQNEGGIAMRKDRDKDYIFVCPHLFQRGSSSCVHTPSPFFPVAPVPPGADGERSVDGGEAVKKTRGDCVHYTQVADMHSSSGSSTSSFNGTSAMFDASSTLPTGSYGIAAATGGCPFCGPWNAALNPWQNMQSLCYSNLSPLASFTEYSSLAYAGIGESPATQQQSTSPTRSTVPATARDQHDGINSAHLRAPSPASKFQCEKNAEAHLSPRSAPVDARVLSRARKSQVKDEEKTLTNLSGSSLRTVPAAEESSATASAESGDNVNVPKSDGATAEVLERGTSAMAVELDRLRKEQHRRWKSGGTADNGSFDD